MRIFFIFSPTTTTISTPPFRVIPHSKNLIMCQKSNRLIQAH